MWLVWWTWKLLEVLRTENVFTPRSTDLVRRYLSHIFQLAVFFEESIPSWAWRWNESSQSLWNKNIWFVVSSVLYLISEDKTSCMKSKKYLNCRRNLPTNKLSLRPKELGEVSECGRFAFDIYTRTCMWLLHSKEPRHKTVRTNLSSIRDSYDVLVLYVLTWKWCLW